MDEFSAVLIGVLLGALGSFLVQTYYSMVSEDIAHINNHISDLSEIEDTAVEYWLEGDGSDRLDSLADKLRGRYHAMGCFDIDAKRILVNDYAEYRDLDGKIFDVAMGGDFQSPKRTRSPETAVQVMRYARELKTLLRRARRKRYWAR